MKAPPSLRVVFCSVFFLLFAVKTSRSAFLLSFMRFRPPFLLFPQALLTFPPPSSTRVTGRRRGAAVLSPVSFVIGGVPLIFLTARNPPAPTEILQTPLRPGLSLYKGQGNGSYFPQMSQEKGFSPSLPLGTSQTLFFFLSRVPPPSIKNVFLVRQIKVSF